jgi:plasmid stabilization system protein ParE
VETEVRFAPAVATDVQAGYRWYEDQRPGLGSQFLDSVLACLERIRRSPELSERFQGQYRRRLLRRFPYAVFYEHDGHTLTIYGVVHTARDPAKWRGRLP